MRFNTPFLMCCGNVGSAGFIAINNQDGADWVQTFTTSLPDGVYCDVVGGGLSNGQCTGYYSCVYSSSLCA